MARLTEAQRSLLEHIRLCQDNKTMTINAQCIGSPSKRLFEALQRKGLAEGPHYRATITPAGRIALESQGGEHG